MTSSASARRSSSRRHAWPVLTLAAFVPDGAHLRRVGRRQLPRRALPRRPGVPHAWLAIFMLAVRSTTAARRAHEPRTRGPRASAVERAARGRRGHRRVLAPVALPRRVAVQPRAAHAGAADLLHRSSRSPACSYAAEGRRTWARLAAGWPCGCRSSAGCRRTRRRRHARRRCSRVRPAPARANCACSRAIASRLRRRRHAPAAPQRAGAARRACC